MSTAQKNLGGRPAMDGRVDENDKVVLVGVKMFSSTEAKFKAKKEELKELGIKTSKSELIRVLAEYSLDWAEDIFKEREEKK